MPEKLLLDIRDIHKSFGMNAVLKGISLKLGEGEVLALIGGNGAGKSTLMKIIMGIYHQDSGEIYVRGEKVTSNKTSAALANGIYMVPQEPLLFPNMTVEENIVIGFDKKASELHKELLDVMKEVGWNLDLTRKASSLSIAEQQMVEILRGLLRRASILILDEPTSALAFDETESLFKCVEDLKAKGIGIIYITHRMAEVFQIATDVAIMRDGIVPIIGKVTEFTREMLGLAGVIGAGRTEIATTVFGRDKVLGGKAILDGKDVTGLSTKKVLEAGINYVPEDRHLHGLFKISDVAANTTSAMLGDKSMGSFFLNKKEEYRMTQKYVDDFRTKVTGQTQLTGSLSGGNQQKVVIGRSLSTSPKLVILDEPTRGIDAGARGDVYSIIHQLRNQGVSVLLISSDMEEIVELSDRVMTVCQGRINGEFTGEDINQDNLMAASFGITKNTEVEA